MIRDDEGASGVIEGVSAGEGLTAPSWARVEGERYERVGVLGAGGMGRVYLARDRWLGRMVALKEAHDAGLAGRLAREVRVTAGLEHPGIVTVYDEGRGADGRPFYTMRLMRGRPLAQVLAERPGLAARLELLGHYLDACYAMAYAHAQGVIHRDLKPENIMVGAFGETQVVDWGLARRLDDGGAEDADAGVTRQGAVLGTPAYMSPEQARGEPADRRADVWGLGAVLHEVLAGAPPPREAPSGARGATAARGALGREVPAELAAIVARTLAEDPDERYPDAGALAEDVAAFLAGRRVDAHRYSALEIGLRFARAWRVPLMVAGVALGVIAALVIVGALRLQEQRDRAVAAEGEALAALAVADRYLAAALVAQARAADDRGAHAVKEVLAAHALRLVDSPEARGVLAGARAAGRPARLQAAPLPECYPAVVLAVDDVVCADGEVIRRLRGGAEVWRVRSARAVREMRAEGERLWVVAHGFDLTTRSLATGEALAEPWELVSFNTSRALPVRTGSLGEGAAQLRFREVCGGAFPIGVAGEIDGARVVLCSDGRSGRAEGAAMPALEHTLDLEAFVSFTHLEVTPGVRRAIVAGARGRVGVLDLTTGEQWAQAPSQPNAVRRLAVAPAGDRAAIVRERGGVELVALPDLRPLGSIPASGVRDLRLAGDGTVVIADGHAVARWAPPTEPRPAILADAHGLSGAVFSPDGRALVTTHGEGQAVVWELSTGSRRHVLRVSTGTVKSGAFLGDGGRFVLADAGASSPGPQVYDLASGALAWQLSRRDLAGWHAERGGGDVPPQGMLGRRVAVLAGEVVLFAPYSPGLLAVDVGADALVAPAGCPVIEWQDLAGAPGGQRAALVSVDGAVWVIEAGSPPRCRAAPAPGGAVAADVSADGQVVAVGGRGFLARIEGAEAVWSVTHPGVWPLDVAISPDGRWIASAGPDEAARVWEAATGALRAVLAGHSAGGVGRVQPGRADAGDRELGRVGAALGPSDAGRGGGGAGRRGGGDVGVRARGRARAMSEGALLGLRGVTAVAAGRRVRRPQGVGTGDGARPHREREDRCPRS